MASFTAPLTGFTSSVSMQVSAIIHCPNGSCQSRNPLPNQVCHKCGRAIPKHYLWAVGMDWVNHSAGELLAGRYLMLDNYVLLDTRPGSVPRVPLEISEDIAPYLSLFPYRPHVPQAYGAMLLNDQDVLLLEKAPIYAHAVIDAGDEEGAGSVLEAGSTAVTPAGQLMPLLSDRWNSASPLRQLHWLWQMAQLWQPLRNEGVATSLLRPHLLRVDGHWLRLLELQSDRVTGTTPNLSQLGELWQQWITTAHPTIQGFLTRLTQLMLQGQIRSGEQLVNWLDQGLATCSDRATHPIYIAMGSDVGPTRQENQDACHPPSGSVIAAVPGGQTLTIVCDGLGGHAEGKMAAQLALDTIKQAIQRIDFTGDRLAPATLTVMLEKAVYAANDLINQQNREGNRWDRQRMGTTVVMALAYAHELYVAHVGDSRAYWINQTGCHQVTLDDDLASHEVRLGYAFYREIQREVIAGSLVQALGMGEKVALTVNVRRLMLDGAGILLVCSDGLSDRDLLETVWQAEVLPVLRGEVELAIACQRLVELANLHNGHDNVTVGLMHFPGVADQGNGVASIPKSEFLSAQLMALLPSPTGVRG